MTLETFEQTLASRLGDSNPADPEGVTHLVDAMLASAHQSRVSDIHLVPTKLGLEMAWRVDGVLHAVTTFPGSVAANIVARLKVLAELLTYRVDIPQEGRIRDAIDDLEMRVSTFPTIYGEKAVVRLLVGSGSFRFLDELGLHDDVLTNLQRHLHATGGVLIASGPAGSGKTTTAYACLRRIVNDAPSNKSLATLEDPIEAVVTGVSQSQINTTAGFDYECGLKSLMRQDPDVIFVGEIRDRLTAETVFQAALTGQLVLTTFHAGTAAESISRLSDMGIEPYLLRSSILGVICQRLIRRLCDCGKPVDDQSGLLGLEAATARQPVGCDACGQTGYRGRIVLAELLEPTRETAQAVLSRTDAHEIERLSVEAGMIPHRQRAIDVLEAGHTSPAEIRRVFGFR